MWVEGGMSVLQMRYFCQSRSPLPTCDNKLLSVLIANCHNLDQFSMFLRVLVKGLSGTVDSYDEYSFKSSASIQHEVELTSFL